MKVVKIVMLLLVVFGLLSAGAFAAGDAAKGKALFNDKKFAGGSKSCNDCHVNGRGLDRAADSKEFRIMGKTVKTLEDAVNVCIVSANMGKAIDVKSAQMQDMVAYLKSLKPAEKSPAKKAPAGY